MKKMNGIIEYWPQLKDQQIVSGSTKWLQHRNRLKDIKPQALRASSRNDTIHGDIGTQWILDLCNGMVKEGCIPQDWKSSMVLPIYKGKGDPMECGSYRELNCWNML